MFTCTRSFNEKIQPLFCYCPNQKVNVLKVFTQLTWFVSDTVFLFFSFKLESVWTVARCGAECWYFRRRWTPRSPSLMRQLQTDFLLRPRAPWAQLARVDLRDDTTREKFSSSATFRMKVVYFCFVYWNNFSNFETLRRNIKPGKSIQCLFCSSWSKQRSLCSDWTSDLILVGLWRTASPAGDETLRLVWRKWSW